jgi:hypothetical protein
MASTKAPGNCYYLKEVPSPLLILIVSFSYGGRALDLLYDDSRFCRVKRYLYKRADHYFQGFWYGFL